MAKKNPAQIRSPAMVPTSIRWSGSRTKRHLKRLGCDIHQSKVGKSSPEPKKVWKSRVFQLEQRNISMMTYRHLPQIKIIEDHLKIKNHQIRFSARVLDSWRLQTNRNLILTCRCPTNCKQNFLVLTHMAPPHPSEIIRTSSSNPDTKVSRQGWLVGDSRHLMAPPKGIRPYNPRCLVSTFWIEKYQETWQSQQHPQRPGCMTQV